MTKWHLAVGAAVALVVVVRVFAFGWVRSSEPVTLHYLAARPIGDSVLLSFAISNRTGREYNLFPQKLERWDGMAWIECPGAVGGSSLADSRSGAPQQLGCAIGRLPEGRLRLQCQSQTACKGIVGFIVRVKARLSGNRRISLNPFHRTVILRR